ncbi:hypothetical protein KFE25_013763 [Diacronema lutheri]|uniref:Uncharacterized protein n=1 Tax=Diacronema lutheri TaxID=2081491 RepID=A0A8J6CG44_DIALT|nr:hypothetical protein KFE25_013763 [Diacronema lutheri]
MLPGPRCALLACLLLLRCNAMHGPARHDASLHAAPRGVRASAMRAPLITLSASSPEARGKRAAFPAGLPSCSELGAAAESLDAASPAMSTGEYANDGQLPRRYDPAAAGTATMQPQERDQSIEEILKQLESIQQERALRARAAHAPAAPAAAARDTRASDRAAVAASRELPGNPKKIAILGTRHCTFLHQQIVELLSYALVLSGNHVFTSGAIGTHTAVIRGALRAENQRLLTVILPQTIDRQPEETRTLLALVEQVHSLGHNELPLSQASRLCNSELLAKAEQLIVFAFHDSHTLKEAVEEGKQRGMLVTVLWLD